MNLIMHFPSTELESMQTLRVYDETLPPKLPPKQRRISLSSPTLFHWPYAYSLGYKPYILK